MSESRLQAILRLAAEKRATVDRMFRGRFPTERDLDEAYQDELERRSGCYGDEREDLDEEEPIGYGQPHD